MTLSNTLVTEMNLQGTLTSKVILQTTSVGNVNLKSLSDNEVLTGFGSAIKSERKSTHEVLNYIIEMEARKLYMPSHTSLYDYMIEVHGYDRNAAWRRISAARVLRAVPVISSKVESGALSLSQLYQVGAAISSVEKTEARKMDLGEKEQLLAKIENSTTEQTELILAQELNLPVKFENKQKIHRDESMTLTITFTKEQMALLEQAGDLISHSVPQKQWADVITYLAQKEIDRRTKVTKKSPVSSHSLPLKSKTAESDAKVSELPSSDDQQSKDDQLKVQQTQRSEVRQSNAQYLEVQQSNRQETQHSKAQHLKIQQPDMQETSTLAKRVDCNSEAQILNVQTSNIQISNTQTATARSPIDKSDNSFPQRSPLSPNVRKVVLNRDKCCQFKDPKTGRICGNTRFPQIDHIQSIWAGGTNDLPNLHVLCAQHNQFKYRKEAGYSH